MSMRGAALAAIETLRRALEAIEEVESETVTVKRTLDATRAELAEVSTQLERAKAEFEKDAGEHAHWRQTFTAERTRGNQKIDQMQEKLRELEAAVTEKRRHHDNIVSGIAALGARLKV